MNIRSLFLSLLFLGVALTPWAAVNSAEELSEKRIRKDLAYLASEECQGRGVETEGIKKAAAYIAKQFEAAGLKPGGKDGTYFQPFAISGTSKLKSAKVTLHGPQGQTIELQPGKQFSVLGYSSADKVTLPLVFAGYGASAPKINYDDYTKGIAEGKAAIVMRHTPYWNNKNLKFDPPRDQDHAALTSKLSNAEVHKAKAMILVNDAVEEKAGDGLIPFDQLTRGVSTGNIPAIHVKRSVVDQLLRTTVQEGLKEKQESIERNLKPESVALAGWKITIETDIDRNDLPVKNVVAYLEGSGPLADEIIVVGAHYDHLGFGERGSLAKSAKEKKLIHYGADDNGSGTTALIELARHYASMKDRQGRKLVFMAFSGEERGLLGSRHYCKKEPLFPLKATAAMVNLDMVGRMQEDPKTKKGKLIIQGTGTAKSFDDLIAKLNKRYEFQISKQKSGFGPSDHASFYQEEIPVLFFFTGTHKDYHRPSDTAERINYKDMLRVMGMAKESIDYVASKEKRPEYVKVARESTPGRVNIPKMGIRPAYDENQKGLLIDGVTAGGPAEKAGMKGGDLIISIADRPVSDINTYMGAMRLVRPETPVEVIIMRGKQKMTLKITPER